ncbi:hypothetical protein B0H10DRAFT_1959979 [Mycena sp. CBHHK59/15]|nr:hypothetical protein B0H10DRAFT_1959979 [Mycena sp. CBHHK59/15]
MSSVTVEGKMHYRINSRVNSTPGIAVGSVPTVSHDSVEIKEEISDQMDSFAGELARMKDTAELQETLLGESIKRVEISIESSLRQLNQTLRAKSAQMDQTRSSQGHRSDDHHDVSNNREFAQQPYEPSDGFSAETVNVDPATSVTDPTISVNASPKTNSLISVGSQLRTAWVNLGMETEYLDILSTLVACRRLRTIIVNKELRGSPR